MAFHNEIGKWGEQLAQDYLTAKGYAILETNYRFKRAEIDIIALHKNTLVVVEVKTRTAGFLVPIAQTVTRFKIQLLIGAANYYVQHYKIHKEVRFDIIAVTHQKGAPTIEHLTNAFYHF